MSPGGERLDDAADRRRTSATMLGRLVPVQLGGLQAGLVAQLDDPLGQLVAEHADGQDLGRQAAGDVVPPAGLDLPRSTGRTRTPTASAPMATANRASSSLVMPQIFTNTPTTLPVPTGRARGWVSGRRPGPPGCPHTRTTPGYRAAMGHTGATARPPPRPRTPFGHQDGWWYRHDGRTVHDDPSAMTRLRRPALTLLALLLPGAAQALGRRWVGAAVLGLPTVTLLGLVAGSYGRQGIARRRARPHAHRPDRLGAAWRSAPWRPSRSPRSPSTSGRTRRARSPAPPACSGVVALAACPATAGTVGLWYAGEHSDTLNQVFRGGAVRAVPSDQVLGERTTNDDADAPTPRRPPPITAERRPSARAATTTTVAAARGPLERGAVRRRRRQGPIRPAHRRHGPRQRRPAHGRHRARLGAPEPGATAHARRAPADEVPEGLDRPGQRLLRLRGPQPGPGRRLRPGCGRTRSRARWPRRWACRSTTTCSSTWAASST